MEVLGATRPRVGESEGLPVLRHPTPPPAHAVSSVGLVGHGSWPYLLGNSLLPPERLEIHSF